MGRMEESDTREETKISEITAPQRPLGKPPWKPMDFLWVAIIFSFGATAILIGLNWQRLGKPQRTWPTIIFSFVGLMGGVTAAILLPVLTNVLKFSGYAINLGVAALLILHQNPFYEKWIATHGRATRKESGCLIPIVTGIGVSVAVFLFAFSIGYVLSPSPAKRAIGHFSKAAKYQETGQLDPAIDEYSKAIALLAQFSEAYINRGKAYLERGDLDLAIDDFNAAISIDPKVPLVYRNRGIANLMMSRFDGALADINKAIELGDGPDAFFARGLVYIGFKERKKAIADMERAIALGMGTRQQRIAEAYLEKLKQ